MVKIKKGGKKNKEKNLKDKTNYAEGILKNKGIVATTISYFIIYLIGLFSLLILFFLLITVFPNLKDCLDIEEPLRKEIQEYIVNIFAFIAGGIIGRTVIDTFKNH